MPPPPPPLSPFVQLWIIKLTKQPPMYTAALARMFVGVLPMALLMHMAVTCYMLGNAEILNVGFVTCVSTHSLTHSCCKTRERFSF